MKPLSIAVIGAGGRGALFAHLVREYPHLANVVAVAEPDSERRRRMVDLADIPPRNAVADWRELLERPKFCDALIITTMDRLHHEPSIMAFDKGYHVLLEKPMATTLDECREIAEAYERSGCVGSIIHSLRYHKAFAKLKELVDSGRIGRLITIDHIEQVGLWHQAHSFVRGNWGNTDRATFMLLAKSCHDIDYLSHLVGRRCLRVNSFGHLTYFRPEYAPEGSTQRCTDGCPVEPRCTFSAIRLYAARERCIFTGKPMPPQFPDPKVIEDLKTSPLGRCVWKCDNDVVDHQVVAMEFEDQITATFTMTGFTMDGGRLLRVHGSEGEIHFSETELTVNRFAERNREIIRLEEEVGGHGGGDRRVLLSWLEAIHHGDRSRVTTDPAESYRTHAIVFAAEQSRREGRAIQMDEFDAVATAPTER